MTKKASKRPARPNAASRIEHQAKTLTVKQAQRMLEGRMESSPSDYQAPTFSSESRRKIEDRATDRVVNITAAEWFGL